MLSGAAQFDAWLASIGTFATFAGVSAYFGWIGLASCGCFGAIRTSPWAAFGVDVALLVLLVVARPARRTDGGIDRGIANVSLGAIAILLALTGIGSWLYGSPEAAMARLRGDALTMSVNYLDFGAGKPGDLIDRSLELHNWTDQPVRLIGGTSDCSCVVTADLPTTIPPGKALRLRVRMKIPASETGALTRFAEMWTDVDRQRTIRLQVGCQVLE